MMKKNIVQNLWKEIFNLSDSEGIRATFRSLKEIITKRTFLYVLLNPYKDKDTVILSCNVWKEKRGFWASDGFKSITKVLWDSFYCSTGYEKNSILELNKKVETNSKHLENYEKDEKKIICLSWKS